VVLDAVVLERLRRLGGEALVDELARIFLADAPVRVESARLAFAEGDRGTLRRELHALKGSALNLGATVLQQRACAGELLAEAGGVESVLGMLDGLEREVARVGRELEGLVRPGEKPLLAVVEDNADNRLLLRILLRERFEISEYVDGVVALEGMRRRRPRLAIVDIALPGMDGTEVLAAMQQDAVLRSVPAIALTAHAMAGDRERLLAAGFAAYVAKPILDEADLLGSIERVLEAAP
jgi:CheY-like chemotaxis protein